MPRKFAWASLPDDQRHRVRTYLQTDGSDIAWELIRFALGSVADSAIVPLQDVLSLETEARMNTPGQGTGNWTWRYQSAQLSDEVAARLGELTTLFNRLSEPGAED